MATLLEQAGAKDLLLAKTLGVVRPIRAGLDGMLPDIPLARLLASSADVGEFRALFEGMFMIALLFTVFFIPVYAYTLFSVENGWNAVDVGVGLALPVVGTATASVGTGGSALAALVARSEGGEPVEQFLGSSFVQKGLNPSPVIPVKAFIFPTLKKAVIDGKNEQNNVWTSRKI